MKEIINIFKANKSAVEDYVSTVLLGIPKNAVESADSILKKYNFIQLMYEVDKEYKQISPVVCRTDRETTGINSDKSHYFTQLKLDEKGLYFSNPYIHYRTGRASISVVVDTGEKYTILDINLILLLEHLRMIEYNGIHEKFKRLVYLIGSAFLSIVSIMLIFFGGYKFSIILLGIGEVDFLQDIFKSIISITLGLAIFDLSKQIFEHEVLFQSFHHPEEKQYKVLGKFLISIVIALAIETLMVVFKIALDDYTHMLSAFYLMIGTTLMFVGLGYFYKTITK